MLWHRCLICFLFYDFRLNNDGWIPKCAHKNVLLSLKEGVIGLSMPLQRKGEGHGHEYNANLDRRFTYIQIKRKERKRERERKTSCNTQQIININHSKFSIFLHYVLDLHPFISLAWLLACLLGFSEYACLLSYLLAYMHASYLTHGCC